MLRILVVEDEVVVGLAMREELRDVGLAVDVCTDAEDASRYIDEHAYAAAVVDVGLPRLQGDELARQTRRRRPDMPIILATGVSASELGHDLTIDDLVAVLEKPFSGAALVACLASLGVAVHPSPHT